MSGLESQPNSPEKFTDPSELGQDLTRELLLEFSPVGKSAEQLVVYQDWIDANRGLVEDTGIEVHPDFGNEPMMETEREFLVELNRQMIQSGQEGTFENTPLLKKYLEENK